MIFEWCSVRLSCKRKSLNEKLRFVYLHNNYARILHVQPCVYSSSLELCKYPTNTSDPEIDSFAKVNFLRSDSPGITHNCFSEKKTTEIVLLFCFYYLEKPVFAAKAFG